MNQRFFSQRNLDFHARLKRLHHINAIFFIVLMITGFLLYSPSFYTAFSFLRYPLKNLHILIGFLSVVPVLMYLPKMKTHVKRKKMSGNWNLFLVLGMVLLFMISGIALTFETQFSPDTRSFALAVHDSLFWVSIPYLVYHSLTRSRWFRSIEHNQGKKATKKQEAMVIEDFNPVYKRKTFLRMLSGMIITIVFSPFLIKALKPYFPQVEKVSTMFDEQPFAELPDSTFSQPNGAGMRGKFRYYTVTENPDLTKENWTFTIDGLVNHKKEYNWEQFMALKREVQVSDFHCVTGWSVYEATLEGIPLKTFLHEAGVRTEAKFVKFFSADGVYTDCLTLDEALHDDVMVVAAIDGKLISPNNGGPVRLMVPKMYAYKSVKWLSRIELIEDEHVGYWEKLGYSQHAWVK